MAIHANGVGAARGSDVRLPRRATSVPTARAVPTGARGRASCTSGKGAEGVLGSIRDMQERGKPSYSQALDEIRNGRKVTHWIWYVWPSLAVLRPGTSRPTFLLPNFHAAQLYLQDDVLSGRLVEITEAALVHLRRGVKPQVLFGSSTDASKFKETMTFFAIAAVENHDAARLQLCATALDLCGRGQLDTRALEAVVAERPRLGRYRHVGVAEQLLTMVETGECQTPLGGHELVSLGPQLSIPPVSPSSRAGGSVSSRCRPRTPH